jgi:hypothetical protein
MTNKRRRDKESCAGDHRKRTSAPYLCTFGDIVTLARSRPSSKVGIGRVAFGCSAAQQLALVLKLSPRPIHVLSTLWRRLPLCR